MVFFVLAAPSLSMAQSASGPPQLEVDAVDDVSQSWEGAKVTPAPPAKFSFELLPGGAWQTTPTVKSPSTVSWSATPEGFSLTLTNSRGRQEQYYKVIKDNGDGTGILSWSYKIIWDGEDITQETIGKGKGGEASYIKKKTAPVKTATENAIGNLMDVDKKPVDGEADVKKPEPIDEAALRDSRREIIQDHISDGKEPMSREDRIADTYRLVDELLQADPGRDILLLQNQVVDLRNNVLPQAQRNNPSVVNVSRYLDGFAMEAAQKRGGLIQSAIGGAANAFEPMYEWLKRNELWGFGRHDPSPYDDLQPYFYNEGRTALREFLEAQQQPDK